MPSDTRDDGVPPHRYDAAMAADIETRWQDRWEDERVFEAPNPAGSLADPEAVAARGEKLFVLDMFPYPSGVGLHVGHPLGYIATDTFVRYQRMQGRNVLYSMGFDAFGLPAEQYAVQTGQHPAITTQQNIENMRRQLRRLGLSHDLRRGVSTTDPEYYRWTQWIFLQIFNSWYDNEADRARPIEELVAEFESGRPTPEGTPWAELTPRQRKELIDDHRLAYLSDSPVNWCPGLGTVVANEEVTADGRSDRGNFPVFTKNMRQWTLRITAYADRLIDDLDLLDWSDAIKTMQRNWIGRSPGARVVFPSAAGPIEVFTTRPDTLFGASFMVLAPEHELVPGLTSDEQRDAVVAYQAEAAARSTEDRLDDTKEKTGVFTGGFATNPVNGQQIPVWIGDYVLGDVGTGAIMAVPCGDQRDFEFATKYQLDIPAIQAPPESWFAEHGVSPTGDATKWPMAFVGDAPYVASSNDTLVLDGIDTKDEGIARTVEWLEATDQGRGEIRYKLRDWLFSRQRYWGEPFPIVYDADGLPHALPDELLPLELPPTDSFMPRSFDPDDRDSEPESPLSRLDEWMEVELDIGDGPQVYRRDHNVMPQWAGSCWYELRYLDPENHERFVDPEVEQYWMGPRTDESPDHPGGVDLYVGGVEHAVLHLLYARFWHKVLFDLGYLVSKEPYHRLFNQGYILANAFKDARGIYVEAADVVERDGAFFHGDEPVSREWGKMGKSLKNAVSPDEMYDEYGADTLRLYEMSMGPIDASRPWEARDVVGMYRFLQRVWRNVVDEESGQLSVVDDEPDAETSRLLNQTVDAVGNDLAEMRFNTAIAKLIELNNHLTKLDAVPRAVAEPLVLMLSPLAPHIAEELWRHLGNGDTLTYAAFPTVDADALKTETVTLPVQVNGKVRSRIEVPVGASEDEVGAAALADPKVQASVGDAEIRKTIVVPDRMVSIVC